MGIKPEVQDGVPEEPGIYYCDLANDYWNICSVAIGLNQLVAVFVIRDRNGNQFKLKEDEFGKFTWSERIEEPEL